MPTPHVRKLFVAGVALTAAFLMLRESCATQLITRGDGEVARGLPASAARFYRRAMRISERSTAAERLVFADFETGSRPALQEALNISGQALTKDPGDAALLVDRGLCAQQLGANSVAQDAYLRAAVSTHDPRLFTLAGWAAIRARHPGAARAAWQAALRIDGHYAPAVSALHRTVHA